MFGQYDSEERELSAPPRDRTSSEYELYVAEAIGERAQLRRENARLWRMVNRLWIVSFILFLAFSGTLGYAFRHLVEPGIEVDE